MLSRQVLVGLGLGLGLAGCETKAPRREQDAGSLTAAPALACAAPIHEFGRVDEGDPVEHTFRLENRGAASLRIERVERAYSCSALDPPPRIGPKTTVDLTVRCETQGRAGKVADRVVVHSNDPNQGMLELEVRGEIDPLLAFSAPLVELSPPFGTEESKQVFLTGKMAATARLRVESISDSGPSPIASIVPAKDGKPQGVRLTLHARHVDRRAGHVVVSTGLSRPQKLILPYSWWVRGNLELDPTRPYINLREPGAKSVTLSVKSTRKGFLLQAAPVIKGPFETSISPDPTGGYRVRIVAIESRIAAEQERGVLGKLELVSNDPFEPRKEVQLFALGVLNRSDTETR